MEKPKEESTVASAVKTITMAMTPKSSGLSRRIRVITVTV